LWEGTLLLAIAEIGSAWLKLQGRPKHNICEDIKHRVLSFLTVKEKNEIIADG
jgi:hypothetical protein